MAVVLLMSANTYRRAPFAQAAAKLGLDVVNAVDLSAALVRERSLALAVDFGEPDRAVQTIVAYADSHPVEAILPLDDSASLVAARAADALGLAHNDPAAALAARDKFVMRQALQAAGLPGPGFRAWPVDANPADIAVDTRFPCVLKPRKLNASRGVIRADNAETFATAWQRTRKIVLDARDDSILVEDYIPGIEVALEGLLTPAGLRTLAIFDKPDPLVGPYFEETIYVTPSRLPPATQAAISATAAQAAAALGLRAGPIHAELRIHDGAVWIVEIAGRSIGGLCSATLRFGPGVSLEELILRQAVGQPIDGLEREHASRGVMMIPIPARGVLRGVAGIAEAEALPGIESVDITAPLHYPLVPLPEGSSYLGFIFAHGDDPAAVEALLRTAHKKLRFIIEPELIVRAFK